VRCGSLRKIMDTDTLRAAWDKIIPSQVDPANIENAERRRQPQGGRAEHD